MDGVGIQKSNKELAYKFLLFFPPNFDGLVTNLNSEVRTQPLSLEGSCAFLQDEELRLKAREGGC